MTVCLAKLAAPGMDLRAEDALDQVASGFLDWAAQGATDRGTQTRAVLTTARENTKARPAAALREAARALHERTGRTAGNGSLMRTAPVALAFLDDPAAMAEAARAVSELTHPDPLAGDACVLWCAAIRGAIVDCTAQGPAAGLDLIPADRRDSWVSHLGDAWSQPPSTFNQNGFCVPSLQAAWSAIAHTPARAGPLACRHLEDALAAAVRIGDDTDTTAAIAGALLGAGWGASAVPARWLRDVHGWPGLRAADLVRMSVLCATRGTGDERGWPSAPCYPLAPDRVTEPVPHPCDDGVILGSLGTDPAAAGADAVVSLCQVGWADFPAVPPGDHLQIWLAEHPGDNNNPHYAVDQAARAVAALRRTEPGVTAPRPGPRAAVWVGIWQASRGRS
jgi:ADP-ribosylglycohydrolase